MVPFGTRVSKDAIIEVTLGLPLPLLSTSLNPSVQMLYLVFRILPSID